MKKYENIYVIGTSHIAQESIDEVEKVIVNEAPKVVALELDRLRCMSLMSKERKKISLGGMGRLGIRGFILNLIGAWIEKRLGESVGVKPGAEMKKAIECAQKVNAEIALIDQDISLTMKKLTREISLKEKMRFVGDLIRSMWSTKKIAIDLRKVPSEKLIDKMTKKVGERYPTVYRVLVHERNNFMAKNLYKLKQRYPKEKIVAVIGAGHTQGVLQMLQRMRKNELND